MGQTKNLGHVPLIDFNHRSPNDTREFLPHEAQRYKERSTAERVNARLKAGYGKLPIRDGGGAAEDCLRPPCGLLLWWWSP